MTQSLNLTYTPHFKSFFKKLLPNEKEKVKETISKIISYKTTDQAPFGLRTKRLRQKIYEARVDISTRIVFFSSGEDIRFIALGNHEDILRALKHIDQIQL